MSLETRDQATERITPGIAPAAPFPTIAHQELCIGCTACSKICPKKCYTHAAVEAA